MNTRSSSRKASDAVVKPAKPAAKKAPPKEVPATKQVILSKRPTLKRSSTKRPHIHFEADVEEVDITEETKEEMEARLRAELTAQVTTQVATEIARLEEEHAAEVLRLETQRLKKKQKKVYNTLEKRSLQKRDGRGTTPATSEIGSDMEACLEYTDKGGLVDYPIMMSLKVYFNGKLESSQTVASSMLRYSIFDLDPVELYASKAITQFLGEFDEYTVKRTAVVRISNPRALLVRSDLEAFDSEGTAIVLDACDHQMRSYPSSLSASFMFEVRVTYLASTLKTFKVTQQPPKEQSPTSMPVPKDRAGKLEVQQNARVEALSRAGDFEAKISRKWQCFDPTCTNENGFCWIDNEDPTCKHYSFLAPAQQAWAAQCGSSLCDENRPPAAMIRMWKTKQGAVGRDSRMPIRKEKKTAQEMMMEMMEMQAQMQAQQMQLDMAQRMADMSEKSARAQEQRELRREQQEQQQALPSSYLPPPQPPSYLPQQISSTRPTSSYRPVSRQRSPPPKSSSPIAQDEDEMDTILRFFDKRIHATVNIERRAKLEAARDVIFTHDWSISDLQTMTDTKGEMYDRAIRAGLSDGMARGFKRDLARFKSEERKEEEERITAQTLTNLTGGGFLLDT